MSSTPAPLGQILLERGIISKQVLEDALAIQARSGQRLGNILVAHKMLSMPDLYGAVASHYALPFAYLDDEVVDSALQQEQHVHHYIRLQTVPLRMEEGITLLATCEPDAALHQWAQQIYGDAYRLIITTPIDIYHHINIYFSRILDAHSREHLRRLVPHQSAYNVLSPAQKYHLLVMLAVLAAAMCLAPLDSVFFLLVILQCFYFFTLLHKLHLFILGNRTRPGSVLPDDKIRKQVNEAQLPVYTILVPLYDEAATIPRLITSLDALDYPKSKLDIKLIVEADDVQTIEAIKACQPHRGYEIIYVPYSLPQTKPKACNYALQFARGRYVTIYDAEDKPDPLQLKKAVFWFAQHPPHVVCLQARLNWYNRDHSLLTRLFALEYAMWFDFMLPGLRRLRMPIPLGGTSNHFDLATLRKIGEWDPYNVTEDADLGVRLTQHGYETTTLDSLTQEEAPIHLNIWMNQRTRWIRGYMQTWLVHMRHPLRLLHSLGFHAFYGFQFFIGGPCLVFLSTPLLLLVSALWLCGWFTPDLPAYSHWVLLLAVFNLLFGLIVHMIFAAVIILRYRWKNMWLTLPVFPFYWLLHSLASYRAVWKLITAPHHWEKTPHGLSDDATHSQR